MLKTDDHLYSLFALYLDSMDSAMDRWFLSRDEACLTGTTIFKETAET